ncbi:hypothetical protein MIND_01281400 [Mycena indigotica]|uniref:Uncharacterized protein n=1 Tax=Mycena indigotica TaxID=2126181 RepID=A0A8H6VX35_9AGAR|nr:uncharacterized protein MIND_01281400 [Mycena indigotica]KAF7291369.1 hypothetical protein MIND_01281400 [Mycena indigotica]
MDSDEDDKSSVLQSTNETLVPLQATTLSSLRAAAKALDNARTALNNAQTGVTPVVPVAVVDTLQLEVAKLQARLLEAQNLNAALRDELRVERDQRAEAERERVDLQKALAVSEHARETLEATKEQEQRILAEQRAWIATNLKRMGEYVHSGSISQLPELPPDFQTSSPVMSSTSPTALPPPQSRGDFYRPPRSLSRSRSRSPPPPPQRRRRSPSPCAATSAAGPNRRPRGSAGARPAPRAI